MNFFPIWNRFSTQKIYYGWRVRGIPQDSGDAVCVIALYRSSYSIPQINPFFWLPFWLLCPFWTPIWLFRYFLAQIQVPPTSCKGLGGYALTFERTDYATLHWHYLLLNDFRKLLYSTALLYPTPGTSTTYVLPK